MPDIVKKLKFKFRRFTQGVNNLVRWFHIIWNDRNFDYYFMEAMMIQKLTFMAEEFAKNEPNYAQRMQLAAKLLERYHDSYYELENTNYYEQDYYVNQFRQLVWLQPIVDNLGNYFDKYPLVYKKVVNKLSYSDREDLSDSETRVLISMRMARINHERCRQLAFKIISMNSPYWWN